jgi:hypothetical protein
MITEVSSLEDTRFLVDKLFEELPHSHKVLGCLRHDLNLKKKTHQTFECKATENDNSLLGVLIYNAADEKCSIWVKNDDVQIATLLTRKLPGTKEFNIVCWPEKFCSIFDTSVGVDSSYLYMLKFDAFLKAKGTFVCLFVCLHASFFCSYP